MEQRIGRYQILEEIAAGAQGAVYRAYDPEGGQIIAIKVLHPTLSGDRTYIERFRREASLAASIDHPNVVKIFEVGQDGDRFFMALEFLPESLAGIIEGVGQLRIEGAAQYGVQIADGLAAAHALGIVHRDVKPHNVLIGPDGTAKVTDFGIARGEAFNTMTATGVMMGTPHYMSPEQSRGERADARSDVYSLGCMVYQMLAGDVPFKGDTPLAVIRQQIDEQPRRLRELRRDLPGRLEALVERSMAKDPGQRYQSVADMAKALRAAVPGLTRPTSPPPREPTPPPPPALRQREPTQPPQPAAPRRRQWAWAGGTLAVVVLTAVIAIVTLGGRDGAKGVTESTAVPTTAPAAPAAAPAPAATLISGRIAFWSDRDGNVEIYVMNADGTGQTRLTNNSSRDESPSWSPDGAKIAFRSDRDGNSNIYVINADGTNLTRLTNDLAFDGSPAWSPMVSAVQTHPSAPPQAVAPQVAPPVSGRIALSFKRHGNAEVYVMNADGTGQARLTNNDLGDWFAPWSPHGVEIAFRPIREGNRVIYVTHADGAGPTRLTNNPAFDWEPAWSPIASTVQGLPLPPFLYSGTATVGGTPVPNGFTIHATVGSYVSQPVLVTGGRYVGLAVGPPNAEFAGTKIAFFIDDIQADQTDTFQVASNPLVKLSFDLTFPELPGPTPTPTVTLPMVTPTPMAAFPAVYAGFVIVAGAIVPDEAVLTARIGDEYESLPAVLNSETGQYFALVVDPGSVDLIGRAIDFYLNGFPSRTTGVYQSGVFERQYDLVFTGIPSPSPTVAPTGTPTYTATPVPDRIAFASRRDGNSEIYVMNADGSGQTRLTNNPASDSFPVWSPDGAKIAFQSSRDGNDEIYLMNADGTGQTRLTNDSSRDESPSWSPDGANIAFTSDRDGNPNIYLINADATGLTRLTKNPAADVEPAWSPAGTMIVFTSLRDGAAEIYVMNADGTSLTRLTNSPSNDESPAWSPT